jgi:thiamine kinase-like enzyme
MALRLDAVATAGGAGRDGKVPAPAARAAARAAEPSPAPRPADGRVAGVDVGAFSAAIDRWEAATAPLAAASGPPVFAHMDLLPGNVMVEDGGGGGGPPPPKPSLLARPGSGGGGGGGGNTPTSGAADSPTSTLAPCPYGPGPGMQFIDFEYARPAPRGFDLGNHWCEWAGLDCDWARCPPPAARAAFAAAYLAEAGRWEVKAGGKGGRRKAGQPPPPPSPSATAALVVEGDAYALAAHLWWSAWALVQARVSPIEFDYGAYAASRFAEFRAREGDVGAAVARLVAGRKAKAGGRWGGVVVGGGGALLLRRLGGCVRAQAPV